MSKSWAARTAESVDTSRGLFCAVSAFLIWGLSPVYWKTLTSVPAFEVVLHRIVWSFFFLVPIVALEKNRGEFVSALRNPRILRIMVCTAVLVSVNWLLFIWSVINGYVIQASLGYFINPLLNIVMGMVFLRERLRRAQAIAVILAGVGVLYLTVSLGQFPWLAFSMAFSFGSYGLIRKVAPVSALAGLSIETLILFPPAAGWLIYLYTTHRGVLPAYGVRHRSFLDGHGPGYGLSAPSVHGGGQAAAPLHAWIHAVHSAELLFSLRGICLQRAGFQRPDYNFLFYLDRSRHLFSRFSAFLQKEFSTFSIVAAELTERNNHYGKPYPLFLPLTSCFYFFNAYNGYCLRSNERKTRPEPLRCSGKIASLETGVSSV